jgi:hypothetical protein
MGGHLRWAARRVLPASVRVNLRHLTAIPPRGHARRGAARRLVPLSREWGSERGGIIDRHYIEAFLAANSDAIHGAVLEVGERVYTRRFGGLAEQPVTSSDVLDPDPRHPEATVIGDLTRPGDLPSGRWDCVICTQVLGLIYDVHAAVATLERILRPGGTLLATVPACVTLCRPDHDLWGDFWRFTPASSRELFATAFEATGLHVVPYGNLVSAAAFLQGLSSDELSREELEQHDPRYPVAIGIRAQRAGA